MSVDTEHGLFFWVEGVAQGDANQGNVLYGHDFIGGVSSLVEFGDSFWLVSLRGTVPLEGRIEMRHSQGRGWTLRLFDGCIDTIPCLLCCDAAVRCVYQGWVRLELDDQAKDLPSLVGDGLPLCAKEWLGVVRLSPNGYLLEAFGRSDAVSIDGSTAYCPWWSESLDDVDGFRVTISAVDATFPPKA
jgi:hypothetical protein